MKLSESLNNVGLPVAYYPMIARWLGSVGDAIFLCQLWYWHGKGSNPDGWIYKTQKEFEEETALGRYEQEHARRKLKSLGILEEERRGVPATLHYRINIDRMNELYEEWYNNQAKDNVVDEQSSLLKTNNPDCGKPTNLIVENWQSITENTTENTTENKDILAHSEEAREHSAIRVVSQVNSRKRDVIDKRFDEFWKAYPKKRSKGYAYRVWRRLAPDEELFKKIMDSLERAKRSKDWRKNDGQFIPYPATWLNAEGWEDEIEDGVPQTNDSTVKRRFHYESR